MRKLYLIVLIIIISASMSAFTQKSKPNESEKKVRKNIPAGYGTLKWGVVLSDAKKGIIGKLLYTDEKKVIVSKDGELEYKYGFFHDGLSKEGKLFYLSMHFPYLSFNDVRKKIEDKYGEATRENINDNQGALAWDSEKTIIILWIDRYENKPYSRRIVYVGKEIAKELNEHQKNVFNKTELEIMKKLNP